MFRIHATTSNENRAAAIVRRLEQDEGITADYGPLDELRAYWVDLWPDAAYLLRSLHTYAVIIPDNQETAL